MSQIQQGLQDESEQQKPPVAQITPAPSPNDKWAWVLAVLPLAGAILLAPLAVLGLHRNWLTLLLLLVSAGLVVVDKRNLARSGRVSPAAMPATAWFLVSPVYLRKRALRLGQGSRQFWVSVVCAVVAPVAGTVAIAVLTLATVQQTASALPACNDPDASPDVLKVFDTYGPAREAGVHGVSLSGQEETGQGPGAVPKLRYCSASVLASDAQEYDVDYTYEQRPDGVIIRLKVRNQQ